jgi:hypothetical protein
VDTTRGLARDFQQELERQGTMQRKLFRYECPVLAVALALAVRSLLDPLLGQNLPLPTFLKEATQID